MNPPANASPPPSRSTTSIAFQSVSTNLARLAERQRAELQAPARLALLARERDSGQPEPLDCGTHHRRMVAFDAEEGLQPAAGGEHHVDQRRDLHEAGPRLLFGPELRAVVEIEEDRHARGVGRLDRRRSFRRAQLR